VDPLKGIERTFTTHIGLDAIKRLTATITPLPVILIAGDQLTGKSTQARILAGHFNGVYRSVGELFRKAAARRGISIAEQARRLLTERGPDVEIDYATCQWIGGASLDSSMAVIEGRQPGWLGMYMSSLGKGNMARLYFHCSRREQVLRFLKRELGEDAYRLARDTLPPGEPETLEVLCEAVATLKLDGAPDAATQLRDNARRDNDDRKRYLELYGFDYRDTNGYDLTVDTDGKGPADVRDEILQWLAQLAPLWATL
jgi:cytidylate kinase